jgi:tetratricopeptide (TPR) repeat protein
MKHSKVRAHRSSNHRVFVLFCLSNVVVCSYSHTTTDAKFPQAVELYTKAIEIDPSSAILYSNRAFAYIKIEQYGAAITDATTAIQLDPKYAKGKLLHSFVCLFVCCLEIYIESTIIELSLFSS